jgi:hypothetical protein
LAHTANLVALQSRGKEERRGGKVVTEVRDVESKALVLQDIPGIAAYLEHLEAIRSRGEPVVASAQMITAIADADAYIKANGIWKDLQSVDKDADEATENLCGLFNRLHKATTKLRNDLRNPFQSEAKRVKGLMSDYDAEQERIRQAEERRLAEEARRAEEARKAAELEEARRIRAEEEARLLAEAQKAEAEGNKVLADAILEVGVKQVEELKVQEEIIAQEPVEAPVVIVEKSVPKVAGGPSYRTIWDAQVVDLMALVKAVAAGTVSINALQANQTFLRQQAMSLKDTFKVPGCKAYSRRV